MEMASLMGVNKTGSGVHTDIKRTWMAHDERDSDEVVVEYISSLHTKWQGNSTTEYMYVIFRPNGAS